MRRKRLEGDNVATGWEHDKRTHFDEIVVNYDKIRPEYPAELISDVIEYAGSADSGKKRALEIGAGTGKATKPFLDAGYDVTAVEAGANMAEFLWKKFEKYKTFRVTVAAFEDAVLAEGRYDLIYAASAFHWVDAEIGCPKVFRLLRSGGSVALFRYNEAFPAKGSQELAEEIRTVYDQHYRSYYKHPDWPVKKTHEEYAQPSGILRGYGFSDLRAYGFTDVTMKFYDAERTFTADERIAFLDTLSDHRNLPEGNRAALYGGVREVILRHGGHYDLEYAFQLYMGRKP